MQTVIADYAAYIPEPLRQALVRSHNIPFVHLGRAVGFERIDAIPRSPGYLAAV